MSICAQDRSDLLRLAERIMRHADAILEAFEPVPVEVKRPPVSPDDSIPPTPEERERLGLPESLRPH